MPLLGKPPDVASPDDGVPEVRGLGPSKGQGVEFGVHFDLGVPDTQQRVEGVLLVMDQAIGGSELGQQRFQIIIQYGTQPGVGILSDVQVQNVEQETETALPVNPTEIQ